MTSTAAFNNQQVLTLLTLIVRGLVDNEEEVEVTLGTDGNIHTFHISCSPNDIGKLIGKHGANAKSLRTLLHALATKYRTHYVFDLERGEAEAKAA